MTDASGTSTLTPKPTQAVERAPEGALSPAVVWQMVRKYWSTALGAALVVSLAATFNTLGQVKIYQAQSTILFDPNPPRPLGQKVENIVDLGSGSFWDNREYYETQYKIIQSMKVATAVVSELGLQHDGGFLGNLPPGTPSPDASVPEEIAAEVLRGRIKVDPVKESRLAVIKLEDADPQRAQRILNVLVDTYVQQNLDDAVTSTATAADWLRSQLDKLKVDLESSEMALHDYKETKNILSVAIDDQSNMLREEMKQLNDTLTTVRTRKEEFQARRDELAKVKGENPTDLPASELLESHVLMGLRTSYEEAIRTRDGLLGEGKGRNYPDVKEADARADAAKKALLAEVKNIQRALDKDLAVLKRQEAGLSGLFERSKKQALDLNLLEIEYNRLRRSKENNEKLYSLVLERTKESDLARVLRVNNIRVLDRPLVPRAPVRPQVTRSIAIGVFLGVLLGIATALARGLLDRSLKTPDEVEKDLGLPFLGLLPEIDEGGKPGAHSPRRQRGKPVRVMNSELIVHEQPTSGIAEAARTIRTNLLFMAPDKPYRTLLITSAGPSEGKTTVATCIAIVMAQAGQKVALIDCDLRRPRVHRVFRKTSEVGVTTAMLEDSLDEAVLETDVPNLSVIPAGPIPPNPAELLHSEKFKKFLDDVKKRFDRVIIDSPPIVPVTDAAVLSTLVDGTVLVVRAFKTTKDLARHAVRALQDISATKAGAVLNAVNFNRDEYKYRYYYYRREGYYEGEDAAAARPARKAARAKAAAEDEQGAGSAPPA
ncbi:GumC family protein [Polyangium sorediatum]|uniref:non-specific protein-tyrosine kinase n=1 Tax=Polyangium sorediatum TaxID=889274 RepID=A0ABT6NXY6_9BACT|nr:polysaccharide biosynthesis tyrosine autokinase [Polyangium sorediatum]MDI1433156.1 polysaccharide biosynthesis tyrosine autokinase [Polyangium sorediatum]